LLNSPKIKYNGKYVWVARNTDHLNEKFKWVSTKKNSQKSKVIISREKSEKVCSIFFEG